MLRTHHEMSAAVSTTRSAYRDNHTDMKPSPPLSRRSLYALFCIVALALVLVVQMWEFMSWITLQQHLHGPTTTDIINNNLVSHFLDPSSVSNTSLDKSLAKKYNESCVQLGRGHMERTLTGATRCFSRQEVKGILTNLTLVTSAMFTAHNITYFLDSGTLLGAVRHKAVIPFDQDVDLGIDANGYETIKTTPILFPKEYVLHVFNSSVHPSGSRYLELPVRVVHRESTLYADVFVYLDYVDSGKNKKKTTGPIASGAFINCVQCPVADKPDKRTFHVPYDWIHPLQPCRFAGYDLPCPQKPQKYLEYMFGKDFMEPVEFPY